MKATRKSMAALCAILMASTWSSVGAQESDVQLVRPDGSYPVKALEKDVVVVKVVQNGVQNLQDAPTVEEGLEENLRRMTAWINKACTEGKKPDFIL